MKNKFRVATLTQIFQLSNKAARNALRDKIWQYCFDLRTEWMLHNADSIYVSCEHLKMKKKKAEGFALSPIN